MTTSIIQNSVVYRQSPQTNNFGTVQALITATTPLGESYNGQKKLTALVRSLSDQFSNGNVSFKPIANQFQFDLYKATKPKVIFTKYITRVVPDSSSNTQAAPNQFYPVVSFKIDFEACCVGSMTLNMTTDIQVRDYSNSSVVINGYSSNGAVQDIAVPGSAIQSFQIAYGLDFVYNYIDKIKLGFCNVGGGNNILHQEVPAEIAKIYHSIIEPPGFSETIRRMVREDVFVIQHNPYHMYGNFAFQLKQDNAFNQYQSVDTSTAPFVINRAAVNSSVQSGFNEIGMYWVDTQIKNINMSPATLNGPLANKQNYAIGTSVPQLSNLQFKDISNTGFNKQLVGFQLQAVLSPFTFGDSQATLTIGTTQVDLMGQIPVYVATSATDAYTLPSNLTLANGAMYKYNNADYALIGLAILNPQNVQQQLTLGIFNINVSSSTTQFVTFSGNDLAAGTSVSLKDSNNQIIFSISVPSTASSAQEVAGITDTYTIGVASYQTYAWKDGGANTDVNASSNGLANFIDGYKLQSSLFIQQVYQWVFALILKQTGAVCPYLNVGNFNYMNIEVEKFNDNDYALNGLQWYYMQGNYRASPNPGTTQQQYQIYRYNAAILNNHANEEYNPTLQNVDYQSIHTFRNSHGVVDFYVPLGFLFICQGVKRSFPHYACSSQSIKVEFTFNNPVALMNTCVAVNPASIDYMDYSNNCRLFINRVDNYTWLQSNGNNMAFVLYYTKYVWIPTLIKAIMNYQFYTWPQKNYERFTMTMNDNFQSSQREICQLSRSVFYTKLYMFVTSLETAQIMSYGAGPTGILPLYINKYDLPIYDVLDYAFTNQQGNNLTGSDALNYTKKFNSVYSYVPFESVQLVTDSQLHMTDETPFRAQMFLDYVSLEWTQQHSAIKLNNMLTFNLDSMYYQVDAPNAVYSPAYGPYIKVIVKPKQVVSDINANRYGVIVISECINISFIQNHVMCVKFQTNN